MQLQPKTTRREPRSSFAMVMTFASGVHSENRDAAVPPRGLRIGERSAVGHAKRYKPAATPYQLHGDSVVIGRDFLIGVGCAPTAPDESLTVCQ
jgi:hypothetical protein